MRSGLGLVWSCLGLVWYSLAWSQRRRTRGVGARHRRSRNRWSRAGSAWNGRPERGGGRRSTERWMAVGVGRALVHRARYIGRHKGAGTGRLLMVVALGDPRRHRGSGQRKGAGCRWRGEGGVSSTATCSSGRHLQLRWLLGGPIGLAWIGRPTAVDGRWQRPIGLLFWLRLWLGHGRRRRQVARGPLVEALRGTLLAHMRAVAVG